MNDDGHVRGDEQSTTQGSYRVATAERGFQPLWRQEDDDHRQQEGKLVRRERHSVLYAYILDQLDREGADQDGGKRQSETQPRIAQQPGKRGFRRTGGGFRRQIEAVSLGIDHYRGASPRWRDRQRLFSVELTIEEPLALAFVHALHGAVVVQVKDLAGSDANAEEKAADIQRSASSGRGSMGRLHVARRAPAAGEIRPF
jgi:hypothetical protein